MVNMTEKEKGNMYGSGNTRESLERETDFTRMLLK